ncbi:MAG: type I 3-dehydroquinate dehydratase [Desulfobulbus sp.]|jgi:3-dehydroquinate dehydratase-1/3-dehydroquinate dehydratase/shikimate dehydrogenase|uniref:type I 3-dehydroquinate dehydratase n=1 Tax=Desulfobulbus sp. TaxID=895 RepID=UPI00284DF660|nr:type I 3-dehydroquinate dehydratase [Desulfobulbus sp.]MDR2549486.1 type I 3-dehydroquinate dehydratase [Desulfobulbus sp.]
MALARGLICVSVLAESNAAVLAAVAPVAGLADVVEIRLDGLREPLTPACVAALGKPVLATNRPIWEGGRFAGSESERIGCLETALRNGAHQVDIELRTAPEFRDRLLATARACGAQVLVSSHDFAATPAADLLSAILGQMVASGADIGKIVTTAATPADALRVLALQQEAEAVAFPLCAFAMGKAGAISRLATLYLGGHMTYAAPSPEQATAPGQITIHNLHRLLALLDCPQ